MKGVTLVIRIFALLLAFSATAAARAQDAGYSLANPFPPPTAPLPPTRQPESAHPGVPVVTFDQLIATAMACNPTLAQSRRRIQALQGNQVQVGLAPNPVVGYTGDEIGADGKAGFQGMLVAQEIVTAGKLGLNRAVVGREIAMAYADLQMQSRRVQNDVTAAAYAVLAARRRLDLADELVHIGDKGESLAEHLFEGKEVSRVDVLQARIEANAARLLRENAGNESRAAWQSLAALSGVPEMASVPLEDRLEMNLPWLDWDASLSRLLAGSPELVRARAAVERARCDVARQVAGRVPNLELAAGVQQDMATEETVAAAGIAIPLQLFDRNQGNIRRARADLSAALHEVRRIELLLQERLADAFKEYRNAYQRVGLYQSRILPDAKEGLALTQEGYAQGELGYLELLTSQRTYFHANLDYVDALKQLQVGATRIEGMLLAGALSRPGE